MIVGFCVGFGVGFSGYMQVEYLMELQLMKMVVSEGFWEDSGDFVVWMVFVKIDIKNEKSLNEIKVFYVLSYLVYQKFSGSVKGMKIFQVEYEKIYGKGDYILFVKMMFWSFCIMVGVGVVMIVVVLGGFWLNWCKKLENSKWYLCMMIVLIFFLFIVNFVGWIMIEIGCQFWMVMGLMIIV